MKKFVATASIVLAVGLSACSSSKSSSTDAATTEAVSAETTVAAPAETAAAESAAAETAAAETAPAETVAAVATESAAPESAAAVAPAGSTYTLKEWSLEGSATLPAGETTLTIANAGNFGHEFVVIKDTTYEDAPKNDLGTVKEDALPAGSILGKVEKIDAGATSTLALNLTPGKYLFVCNIEFGPNSHAGKGQRLNVTVA